MLTKRKLTLKLTLDHNVSLEKIKSYEAEKYEPKNDIEVVELKLENQVLRRKLAALDEVKQSTSFDQGSKFSLRKIAKRSDGLDFASLSLRFAILF